MLLLFLTNIYICLVLDKVSPLVLLFSIGFAFVLIPCSLFILGFNRCSCSWLVE